MRHGLTFSRIFFLLGLIKFSAAFSDGTIPASQQDLVAPLFSQHGVDPLYAEPASATIDERSMKTQRAIDNITSFQSSMSKMPKGTLDAIVAKIAGKARAGADTFCLFNTNDGCFYRNAQMKLELSNSGYDPNRFSTSVIVMECGPTKLSDVMKRGFNYHTAAVIYTDQGPFIFDPANKSHAGILEKNDLLTKPSLWWIGTSTQFNKPAIMLAPAGVITPADLSSVGDWEKIDFRLKLCGKFAAKTPDDKVFDAIRALQVDAASVNDYRNEALDVCRQSDSYLNVLLKK